MLSVAKHLLEADNGQRTWCTHSEEILRYAQDDKLSHSSSLRGIACKGVRDTIDGLCNSVAIYRCQRDKRDERNIRDERDERDKRGVRDKREERDKRDEKEHTGNN